MVIEDEETGATADRLGLRAWTMRRGSTLPEPTVILVYTGFRASCTRSSRRSGLTRCCCIEWIRHGGICYASKAESLFQCEVLDSARVFRVQIGGFRSNAALGGA
jgi:hypothetical protein